MARSPQGIGSLLDKLLHDLDLGARVKESEPIVHWEKIVGARIAAVTKPEKVQRGTLIVKVSDPVWRYELSLRKQDVIARIHSVTGSNEITDIRWL
jgi:predicted nucleic acid-binding Zn ribbon protein